MIKLRIKECCKEHGVKLADLATALGIRQATTLSQQIKRNKFGIDRLEEIAKIIGCGLMSRICGFKGKDCLKIGVGMMTRGEVALIVSQKGLSVGLLTPVYFTAVILLIIVSSISTPIILKLLYSGDKAEA